jgi:hypothetical protein
MGVFEDPYWNCTQVLSWVQYRDKSLVDRAADDAPKGFYWHFIKETVRIEAGPWALVDEEFAKVRDPFSRGDLEVMDGQKGGAMVSSLEAAESAIINELASSRLEYTGLRNGDGDREKGPALQWRDLRFKEDKDNGELYACPKGLRSGATQWRKLEASSEQVLSIWPDPLASISSQDSPPEHDTSLPDQVVPRSHEMAPKQKAKLTEEAVTLLHGIYKDLNAPRSLNEDWADLMARNGRMTRDVATEARKRLFVARGFVLRRGRPAKKQR